MDHLDFMKLASSSAAMRLGMLPLRWILAALILASAAGLVFLAWWAIGHR